MSGLMSLVAGPQAISMFVAGPVAEEIGISKPYYASAALLVNNRYCSQFAAAKV